MENCTHKSSSYKIVFRADGNQNTGLGHVYRCLALAEMLQEHFFLSFAICSPDKVTVQQISTVCDEIIKLTEPDIQAFANNLTGNEIVVLDGYGFNTEDQKLIKSKGCLLVCIDDLHNQHFVADVVVNHSLTANNTQYSTEPYTILCTGVDFVLLRKQFLEAAKERVKKTRFQNAFICFGGADTNNFSYRFLKHLSRLDCIDNIHILIGSAFRGSRQEIKNIEPGRVHLHQNLGATDIIKVMQECDFAIVSASSVAYECAAAGLPILTGYYLDSQIEFYEALLCKNNVWGLGNVHHLEFDLLTTLVMKLPSSYDFEGSFIDGYQAERYLKLFHTLLKQ